MSVFRINLTGAAVSVALMAAPVSHADETIEVDMYKATTEGRSEAIGTVTLEEHRYGTLIKPSLEGLSPGLHGFHLHENPSCEPAMKDGKQTPAASAGGHVDPEDTNAHRGPYDPDGHLGDLPALVASRNGEAILANLAPRLTLDDMQGHALVIHEGGDNYSDDPRPLGGGGARVACGVISGD
ncbi:superoxide dismutase [Cu-Zn] SodC [Marinobacter sp. OP 3.4]|uniref:superoxide dismutase [Cu-Zn] SodC n=1 Tax=Marinobacter sp. OP 3.4 TaxID=3076501 RepID=UPI002E1F07E3